MIERTDAAPEALGASHESEEWIAHLISNVDYGLAVAPT